ncbi:MAG: hypothetical protein AAF466_08275 [Bacteroidota bacterium]
MHHFLIYGDLVSPLNDPTILEALNILTFVFFVVLAIWFVNVFRSIRLVNEDLVVSEEKNIVSPFLLVEQAKGEVGNQGSDVSIFVKVMAVVAILVLVLVPFAAL